MVDRDVSLQPLAAPADVDLFPLQTYELASTAAALGVANAGTEVTRYVTVAATGHGVPAVTAERVGEPPAPPPIGGTGRLAPRLRPVPPRRPLTVTVHAHATATGHVDVAVQVAPFGRWLEEELLELV